MNGVDQFHNIDLIYLYLFFPICCKNVFKKKEFIYALLQLFFFLIFFILEFFFSYHYIVFNCPLIIIATVFDLWHSIENWPLLSISYIFGTFTDYCKFSPWINTFLSCFHFFFILCLISKIILFLKKSHIPLECCWNFRYLRQLRVFKTYKNKSKRVYARF